MIPRDIEWNTKGRKKRRRGTPLQHYSRYVKISAALSASILTKHIGGGQGYPFHVRQRMFLFVYLHIALGCINSISKRFQRRPSPWNFNLLIKLALKKLFCIITQYIMNKHTRYHANQSVCSPNLEGNNEI